MGTCSIRGCETAAKTRGMCNRHYLKWWKYGDAAAGRTIARRGTGGMHKAGYRTIAHKLVHRLVAAEMLGRPLRRGEVVHHIDGNKLNNEPGNLRVFASQAEHAAHHNAERRTHKE